MDEAYWHKEWQTRLTDNHLGSFDAIWQLKTSWFEQPNRCRGGWSGVVNIDLTTRQDNTSIFIKRQENHATKTVCHPLRGIPTLQREFCNILRMKKYNLPTVEPVFFAKRISHGKLQAILITKALTGYVPLSSNKLLPSGDLVRNIAHKRKLLMAIANTLRSLHHHHFQHNCCYPKHIFVKPVGTSWDIRIIDLEKLKWRLCKKRAMFRDIYTLHKHAGHWLTQDQIALFKAYTQEKKLSTRSKTLIKSVEKRARRKHE